MFTGTGFGPASEHGNKGIASHSPVRLVVHGITLRVCGSIAAPYARARRETDPVAKTGKILRGGRVRMLHTSSGSRAIIINVCVAMKSPWSVHSNEGSVQFQLKRDFCHFCRHHTLIGGNLKRRLAPVAATKRLPSPLPNSRVLGLARCAK